MYRFRNLYTYTQAPRYNTYTVYSNRSFIRGDVFSLSLLLSTKFFASRACNRPGREEGRERGVSTWNPLSRWTGRRKSKRKISGAILPFPVRVVRAKIYGNMLIETLYFNKSASTTTTQLNNNAIRRRLRRRGAPNWFDAKKH